MTKLPSDFVRQSSVIGWGCCTFCEPMITLLCDSESACGIFYLHSQWYAVNIDLSCKLFGLGGVVSFCCCRCHCNCCWLDNELHDAFTHASNKSWFFHKALSNKTNRMRCWRRGSERTALRRMKCIKREKKN